MSIDVVRVWLVSADVPEPDVAPLLDVLDDEERARAAALLDPPDRHRFVVAHVATRFIVGAHLRAPAAEIQWIRGRHGKPELTGAWTGITVNLSHSADLSMVAITASRAVGVDIQQLVPGLNTTAMAARYFPPAEAHFVAAAGDADVRAARFARLWTRKESVIKAQGGRLIPGLRTPVRGGGLVDCADDGAYRVTDVRTPHGFRAAVALAGGDDYRVTLRRWRWPVTVPAQRSRDAPAPAERSSAAV